MNAHSLSRSFDVKRLLAVVVVPIVFGYAVAYALTGCGSTFQEIEDAAKDGDVPAKLRKCRAEARAAYYVGEKSEDEAMQVYTDCKKREGL